MTVVGDAPMAAPEHEAADATPTPTGAAGSSGARCSLRMWWGLRVAFTIAEFAFGQSFPGVARDHVAMGFEFFFFLLTLPGWVVIAKLYGLYERDEERADHSTVDDLTGIFHLVTVGVWLAFRPVLAERRSWRPTRSSRRLLGPGHLCS